MCVLVKKDEKIKEDVFWIFFHSFISVEVNLCRLKLFYK